MKILVVSKYFHPVAGGVERVAYEAMRRVAKTDRVAVLASCAPDEKPECRRVEGMQVARLPTFHVGPTPVSPGTFWRVLRADFDIAHLHEPNPAQNFFAYLALLFKRRPYVVTYHSDLVPHALSIKIFKPFYLAFQRLFLLRGAARIMPTSPQYVKISDVLPFFKNKITIVPNGVDPAKFRPKRARHAGKRILFVGRLIYYKGLEHLVRALPTILEKVPDARLAIVGAGPLETGLKKLARECGVAGRVEWRGELAESALVREYWKADVFVLPSTQKTEAFGIVLLEAMACGTPVLTTGVSGTAYAAGDAGILMKPGDARALADAVVKILGDERLAARLRKRGLKRVKNFSWNKIAGMVEKVYENTVSG